MATDFEVCIVGGGVVGLAIAHALSPHCSVLLTEKNELLGAETSSRNSEVIHAGLYYPPGSLKETLCLRGKALLYDFCRQHHIPHQTIGKLIVAPQAGSAKLQQLWHKGTTLGVPLQWLDRQQIQQLEPEVNAAEALLSPTTGIIDSHHYMQELTRQAERHGALLMRQTRFISASFLNDHWQIQLATSDGPFATSARWLINCAGLQAQAVAGQSGMAPEHIPPLHLCRGHYFSYATKAPFTHLIYPLPEENLAGLGVHATLDLGGQVRFGPDTEYLPPGSAEDYRVAQHLAARFAAAIRPYFPGLEEERLQPAYAGIRPKLHLAHETTTDFVIRTCPLSQRAIHLFGIESPGLTASLAIAEHVTGLLPKIT